MTETVAAILHAHRTGAATPADMVTRSYARIRAHADPAVFISLREESDAIAEARALMASGADGHPLYAQDPDACRPAVDLCGRTSATRELGKIAFELVAPLTRSEAAGGLLSEDHAFCARCE